MKKTDAIRSLIEQINAENPTLTGRIRAIEPQGERAESSDGLYEFSFSSEEPYERWFGIEVLGHDDGEVRMDWINSGNAPLLLQHDHDRQIGVIESARINNGRGTAVVRFGKSALAQEIRQDVDDGIRTNVSVGYRINDMKLVRTAETGTDEYRVTDWMPFEVSSVSVPADMSVGTNRAAGAATENIKTKESKMDNLKKKAVELGLTEDASPEAIIAAAEKAAGTAGRREAENAHKTELHRRDAISALAKQHKLEADAKAFIEDGRSAADFQAHILSKYESGYTPLAQLTDLSVKEQKDVSGFSLLRAVSLLANGQPLDGVEREVSAMGADEAKICGIESSRGNAIMVPSMLMRATAASTTATAGGEFVPSVTSANVIDTLRNQIVIGRIGGRILTGLAGNLKLPKITTSPSGSSATEVGTLSNATIVTAELELSPHRIGATIPYSNQLFLQSSPDVDALLRDQLIKACALRADYLMLNGDGTSDGQWYGILNYSGVGSVASGDNGKAVALADIVGLETEVAADNADVGNLRYLTSARGRGILKQTPRVASTDSIMLWGNDNMMNGYQAEVSNQVPSNVTKGTETSNTTSIVFGDWNKAILGFFGGQEVVVDPYTLAKNAQTQITVNMFADGDLEHAEAFAVMDGVHQS
jgi:HK97 family phage major capsid protein